MINAIVIRAANLRNKRDEHGRESSKTDECGARTTRHGDEGGDGRKGLAPAAEFSQPSLGPKNKA